MKDLIALLLIAPALGQDWTNWRGPHFDGSTETGPLPAHWSRTENVAWKTAMPGPGSATPCVCGERVFVTAIDEESMTLLAIALDRASGKVLWQHEAGSGQRAVDRGQENYFAECSPVTDGQVVAFMFGNGRLLACDFDGRRLWDRNLVEEHGPFDIMWGYASSPLLHGGILYVQVLRSGESFLLAIDPKSGRDLWRHVRDDPARDESEQAYTTPIPFDNGGHGEILVYGADCLTGHDARTGAERWRWCGANPGNRPNFRVIASPVPGRDGFIFVSAPRGSRMIGLRVKDRTVEEVWESARPAPDVETPLLYGNRLYVVDGARRRKVACMKPESGEKVWEAEIETPTHIRASPLGADGKVYIMDAGGVVTILKAGDAHEVLARIDMESYPSRSSIVADDGQLLIRTADFLYCIGGQSSAEPPTRAAMRIEAETAPDQHWPSFRGHRACGVMEGHRMPVSWNIESRENIRWKAPVPGLAHSSPVVWGRHVYVTTAVRQGEGEDTLRVGLYGEGAPVDEDTPQEWRVYCFDRERGEIVWERQAHAGVPKVKRHPKSSHANPTPACDGRHVVAFFGSEGLYCYDLTGGLLWKKDLGVLDSGAFNAPDFQWGFASSPILHEGRVIVQCDVNGDSFLAAFDAGSGAEIWRTSRDEVPTWSTPTIDTRDGRSQVIVNGWKHIGGYDLGTGRSLWRLRGGGDVPVPTPVVAHDLVFITNAHGRLSPIYAVRATAEGEVAGFAPDEEHMAWSSERRGSYMQTPLVYGEELYLCNDAGVLSCYEAKTGQSQYRERLGQGGSGFSASPVAGDGKIYLSGEEGAIHVVKAGSRFESLSVNEMGETCMATPAISQGVIFIRTRHHLYAVAEGPSS